MSLITICSASFCRGDAVAAGVAREIDYRLVTDGELIELTSRRTDVAVERLQRAMGGVRPVFNRFTHERERCVAEIRHSLALLLLDDDVVLLGPAGHLLPPDLAQVLRVGLAAPQEFRVQAALGGSARSRGEAQARLEQDDEMLQRWTQDLFGCDPWTKGLYDVFLPMDTTSVDDAVRLIVEAVRMPAVRTTTETHRAAADFSVSSRVLLALAEAGKGEGLEVRSLDGALTITINRYVTWLEHFEREVGRIAAAVEGVTAVKTRIGPHFTRPNVYPGLDDTPRKILLVDDEVEFVQTLSERLQTRNMESAIAYDGEEALAIAENDAPDVMVLDMKMPGMDGLQVLEQIRQRHPRTEVIILTAHGSDIEAQRAAELGAFAYLRKPADIDELTRVMKEAYGRVVTGQASGEPARTTEEGGDETS